MHTNRIIVAAALFLAPAAAAAECQYTPLRLGSGTRSAVQMIVQRDTACTMFTSANPTSTADGISTYLDVRLAKNPASGIAGIASKHEWGYKPHAGFVGRDRFVVRMDVVRNTYTKPESIVIDVDVIVR